MQKPGQIVRVFYFTKVKYDFSYFTLRAKSKITDFLFYFRTIK